MAVLCFLLDLPTIPPPLLLQLKEYLLRLANLYAASPLNGFKKQHTDSPHPNGGTIGLCYIARSADLQSDEMKVAYCPGVDFSLRDFHHAVKNLPMDRFLSKLHDYSPSADYSIEASISGILHHEVLHSRAGEDVFKKLVFIGSSLIRNTEALRASLSEAEQRSIFVEFVLLDHDHDIESSGKFQNFLNSLINFGYCKGKSHYPEDSVLHALIKRWLQELTVSVQGLIRVLLVFEESIFDSKYKISCKLFPSVNQISDGIIPCQTCRCHGKPISNESNKKSKHYHCQVTNNFIEVVDLVDHAVKLGEETVLFLPSECCPVIYPVTNPIPLKVIKRVNMATLDEGMLFGMPYIMTSDACDETGSASSKQNEPDLNGQIFKGLCGCLSFLDQCLLCSSTCNIEMMKNCNMECFYVLQPSFGGSMLLRRIAASEEILPFPEAAVDEIIVSDETMHSVQEFLLKIPIENYNPLLHERHLHAKLNCLVKESMQLGAIPDKQMDTSTEDSCMMHSALSAGTQLPETQSGEVVERVEDHKDTDFSCVSEEWERLVIVDEMKDYPSRPDLGIPILNQDKPIDAQTSKILERLEPPKQKRFQISQASNGTRSIMKKPVPPSSNMSVSQPMKPAFHRLKRKQI